MASYDEIPKLPLSNLPPIHSPERSGMVTPPLQITASIPFLWEQEPGKPKPCTTLVTFSNQSLELPPRLLIDHSNFTKISSPTMGLDGPYEKGCCCDSESGKLGTLILKEEIVVMKKGLFCFWRRKEIKDKNHVFLSCSVDNDKVNVGNIIVSEKNVKMKKIKHYGSFYNPFHAKSHVWTKMCEGWKRVVPWKSEKVKKCWWF